MIEIDSSLLSDMALDNLVIEVITRHATEYGEYEINLQIKKEQLIGNIKNGSAVIVFSAQESICDIISLEEFRKFQKQIVNNI
jgi:uncharacterized protein YheU (UPF0270 family)